MINQPITSTEEILVQVGKKINFVNAGFGKISRFFSIGETKGGNVQMRHLHLFVPSQHLLRSSPPERARQAAHQRRRKSQNPDQSRR